VLAPQATRSTPYRRSSTSTSITGEAAAARRARIYSAHSASVSGSARRAGSGSGMRRLGAYEVARQFQVHRQRVLPRRPQYARDLCRRGMGLR